jgi:5'(3')-deoxyribonucleotidase
VRKLTVFLDLDGVLADFEGSLKEIVKDPPEMFVKGFFRNLEPHKGAKEFVDWALKQSHFKLYIATKPSTKNLWSTIEKYKWVQEHFPYLLKRIMLTCDKGLLLGDILVDDDIKQWGKKFKGEFFHFDKDDPKKSWIKLTERLSG